jgi:hypothetical protein
MAYVVLGWPAYTAKNKYRKFEPNIFPEKELRPTVPISTFMCLWAIHIFQLQGSICLFRYRKNVDQSWEYIYRSHRHTSVEIGTEAALSPRKGIHKWDFRCSVRKLFVLCAPPVALLPVKFLSLPVPGADWLYTVQLHDTLLNSGLRGQSSGQIGGGGGRRAQSQLSRICNSLFVLSETCLILYII